MANVTMTDAARAGYDGNPNPHLWSSAMWFAHELGAHLHATGRAVPSDVRMSRGYSVRCRDMIFAFDLTRKPHAIERTR